VQHLIDSYQPFIVHSRPVNPDLITSHPNLLIYSAKRQTKYCPRHLLLLHHVHCTTLLSLHVKTMLRQICLVTVPPVGQQITVITMSVCLCVCLPASISLDLEVRSLPNFVCLWPWLGPLAAWWYDMHFRFYGWRHICTKWPIIGNAKMCILKVTHQHPNGGGVWYLGLPCYRMILDDFRESCDTQTWNCLLKYRVQSRDMWRINRHLKSINRFIIGGRSCDGANFYKRQ